MYQGPGEVRSGHYLHRIEARAKEADKLERILKFLITKLDSPLPVEEHEFPVYKEFTDWIENNTVK